tara:strand:+ start:3851 stop:4387 length:537 start_codon:yes stop_codon:yes gene_type:complete
MVKKKFKETFVKVNVSKIIKNHLGTLVNANTKKASFGDYFVFLILPLIIASTLIYFNVLMGGDIVNIIITGLAIFVGLLFNVIVLLFTIIPKDIIKERLKVNILEEVIYNCSFTILLSILCIILCVFTKLTNPVVIYVVNFISYYFFTLFLFTLLMILKRLQSLLTNEFEELKNSSNQ